jgi:serine/threonine-protein kinase
MAYLLLACPKCHAAYKILSDRVDREVTCRSCEHRWVPSHAAPVAAANGSPAASLPQALPADDPAGALEALARAVAVRPPASSPRAAPAAAPGKAAAAPRHEGKADPLVGMTINGFKIQGRIGSGGFGVVYRAFDTNLERSVAIKMLPPRIAKSSAGLLERFRREALSAAKLSHPNIVTIHQICPYKDTYYIVMELVEGGALHEFLAVQKRFDPKEATRIVRAAAEGLGHAHRRGIIHRDIKPGNIMMTNDGQVKVSDFGLARDVLQGHDIVGPGHSLGTPRYMAPEQALGNEPTAASDLYSLAGTYYALLTGRPPFDAPSDRELMKKHVTEELADPRKYVPDLPVSVFRFFERAMAKPPEDRYQTAEEFVEALDRLDFSGTAATTSAALSAQIGTISAEDRGTHLTEALSRAVRRAQRQRTPASLHAPLSEASQKGSAARPSWAIWVLAAAGVVVLIVVAVVAAVLLSQKAPPATPPAAPPAAPPSAPALVPPVELPKPPAASSQPPVAPQSASSEPSAEPAAKPPTTEKPTQGEEAVEKPPAAAPKPLSLEEAAQEALEEVKKYETDSSKPRWDVIRKYEENVINVYSGTKAAEEAQKAVDRLKAAEKPAGSP